jgi:ribosomal protein S10
MKSCHLILKSKNRRSLGAFLGFFRFYAAKFKLYFLKKIVRKKRKKTVVTILKSPHVHKKAQEQFETRYFLRQLSFYTVDYIKCAIFLKRVKAKMFSNLHLKTKFTVRNKVDSKFRIKIFNPDNYIKNNNIRYLKNYISQFQPLDLQSRKIVATRDYKKTRQFLKRLDVYGEFLLKKDFV